MPAKISSFSLLLLLAFSARALACGVYELSGVIRFDKSGYRIVTAEGTKSETVFAVPAIESPKLVPYRDMPVKASVLIQEPFNGTRARISKIETVSFRVPEPLRGSLDSRFTLKTKQDCRK